MKTKLNNKGMSLVELLIAIAIAAVVSTLIVTMMTSGTRLFRSESEKIDAQSDMQVVQNQVADILRQAKGIYIVRFGDNIRIYTGPVDETTNKLKAESGSDTNYTDSIITYDSSTDTLYITNSYMETIPAGYILSENVTEFDISIASVAEQYTESETNDAGVANIVTKSFYDNPISVNIKIDIGTGTDKKDADMTVKIRNKIDDYVLYSPSSFNQYLSGAASLKYELR